MRFLAETEILVVLLPLTPETRGLLDAPAAVLLPQGAKLDQCLARRRRRRGGADRGAAIRRPDRGGDTRCVRGRAAAAKDPFWRMDNVLITPHLASITVPEDAAREVAESIRRVRSGAEPLHLIDPRRGY